MSSNPAPSRGGLSLYANLLNPNPSPSPSPSTANTISSAPVVYKQLSDEDAQQHDDAVAKKQINAAALRFQPTKRPQITSQKPKPKTTFPKPAPLAASSSPDASTRGLASVVQQPTVKSTLADWTADDDYIHAAYAGEKRQRGGRKKRKKNREEAVTVQDWDDIYDPSRPNSYEEYNHSEEKIREIREWKDRLYAHRMVRRRSSDFSSEEDYRGNVRMNARFAPPSNYSFAPPSELDPVSEPSPHAAIPLPPLPPSPPPPPPPQIANDATGEDAYARRLRLSQLQQKFARPQSSPPSIPEPPLHDTPLPPPPTSSAAPPAGTIFRAAVRYNLPTAPAEFPASEAELEEALQQEAQADDPSAEDAPRSLRPGQKGFAERLMAKYGWTKGTGLGASGSGIVNPLRVQIEKRKQRPDSEGGGFVGPGGKGKIVGGKKGKSAEAEEGRFGAMSEVVVLFGMVDGLDLDKEMGEEGSLVQEIGEECGEKYGRVERVFVNRTSSADSIPVFVKFTSQLSALRAVNALEGRVFNGNTIRAKFFDAEKFERGVYQ